MIRLRASRKPEVAEEVSPRGFDDFELRLGDMMRGERATLGKSLLDVQRELRIKANYIAAIENCDPSAFDTPGFIAGYVRSYARYLGMDPDHAFEGFCAESGFSLAHGMSPGASVVRKSEPFARGADHDPFAAPATPFVPETDSFLDRIEPRAVGSLFVLALLIGGIGYGGWTVLNEVQRVQFAPVENTPDVLADLDPLQPAVTTPVTRDAGGAGDQGPQMAAGVFNPPSDALDRLYRPQALDVPVMVARDAPISTLDPSLNGAFAGAPRDSVADATARAVAAAMTGTNGNATMPQVVEGPAPALEMVAVRPAWVRVRAADGSVIFEGIMESGERWAVPATEEPPTLRVGESGAIYFAVNGQHYGPAGARGSVTSNLPLATASLTETYAPADPQRDGDLAKVVAELQVPASQ
ncbi:MAG: helix-turn-helix domain-containing protein [Paracoccaceae bacterium]